MTREFPKNSGPQNIDRVIQLPTVGRIVHIFGNVHGRPCAAIVANVHSDKLTIACCAFDEGGRPCPLPLVPHVSQKGDYAVWWDWMDYQKGQAAKTEELEQKLAGAQGGPQTIAPSEVLSDEAVANFEHKD